MSLQVYTSSTDYPKKGWAIEHLDVSVDTGDKVFAPSMQIYLNYQSKLIDHKMFKDRYRAELRQSYVSHRDRWDELLSKSQIVIISPGHRWKMTYRGVLAQVLEALGAVYLGEI